MDCILILVFNALMCFIKSFLVMLHHLICKTVSMLDVYIDCYIFCSELTVTLEAFSPTSCAIFAVWYSLRK